MENKYTAQRIFEILHQIPLDIEGSNITKTGWYPDPEWDAEGMSKEEVERLTLEAIQKDSKVLFTNVSVHYDSCDCEGWCNCSDWVYEIVVMNGENRHEIEVDEDHIGIYNNEKGSSIPPQSTIYDFYRMCELVGVELEFSEYAKQLLK